MAKTPIDKYVSSGVIVTLCHSYTKIVSEWT